MINLGIKQDVTAIINVQKEHHADCICMSGLLVKSTAFMKENLGAFKNVGIQVPVILGGAVLTPRFVHRDCRAAYQGQVVYGRDAFTDLRFKDVTPVPGQRHQEEGANRCRGTLAWAWGSYPWDSAETPPIPSEGDGEGSLEGVIGWNRGREVFQSFRFDGELPRKSM